MKVNFFYFLLFFFFLACKEKNKSVDNQWVKISERISYFQSKSELKIKSGEFNYTIETKKLPYQRVVLLNSSLMGYILELGQESKILGVVNPKYIFSSKVKKMIEQGKIQNFGNEEKYDVEKILASQPDVILTNYIPQYENLYKKLKNSGVEVIFIDEYKETSPLEKSKILLLFGELLGVERKAQEIFTEVEKNYKEISQIAQKTKKSKKIIAGEMYGNHWFMPSGGTFAGKFFKDANADYFFSDRTENSSQGLTLEEVIVLSKEAYFWVNIGGNYKNKKEMLEIQPHYEKIKTFQKGELYSISGRVSSLANDYFESGAVRADRVLRDYVKIFHPHLYPKDTLVYMKKIE